MVGGHAATYIVIGLNRPCRHVTTFPPVTYDQWNAFRLCCRSHDGLFRVAEGRILSV